MERVSATWVELGGRITTLADRFTRLATSPGCNAFVAEERALDLRSRRRCATAACQVTQGRGAWPGARGR